MKLLRQTATYGVVGLAVYAIDYALFAGVVAIAPAALLAANAAGRVGGALAGYLLHARFTFPGAHRHARALPRYLALFLTNLAGSSLLLLAATAWLALPALAARLLVDAVVIAASFAASRAWVYARP
jgi:putative flippase GtrA